MQRSNRRFSLLEHPWLVFLAAVGLLCGAMFISSLLRSSEGATPIFCKAVFGSSTSRIVGDDSNPTELQLIAIVHYATSRSLPQQNIGEISVSSNILKALGSSCNFLVFGLGHDSLMWASLNSRGTTIFLEEDPTWVKTVLKDAPYLRAETVKYRTQLSEAEELLNMYRSEPDCWHDRSFLRGNDRCKLALNMLSDEIYDKEWDLIMVDAPRGYFPAAPGRMSAIYSAAVMARNRKKSGVTHVFLHDVDRKVEKVYAEMFLCRKYLVNEVGRLWHFEIPPTNDANKDFCQ